MSTVLWSKGKRRGLKKDASESYKMPSMGSPVTSRGWWEKKGEESERGSPNNSATMTGGGGGGASHKINDSRGRAVRGGVGKTT